MAAKPWPLRRHAVAQPELLAEVVLRVEAAPAGHLRDAYVAGLEEARRFLEALLLQELAEQAAGDAMEPARNVLPRVAELFGHGFHSDFLVRAKAASHCFDQRSQQAVHTILL